VKDTPPLPCKNYFNVLAVEEIEVDPSTTTDISPVPETARTEKMWKSKLEKKLPKKLNVGAAEIGPNSLYLQVEIESTDNQQKYGVRALVDSGATGLFIDREYVKSNQIPTTKLPQPIPVFNVDGTANTEGSISEVAELLLRYNGHLERALFCCHWPWKTKPHPRSHMVEGSQPGSRLEDWKGRDVSLLAPVLQWMPNRSKRREKDIKTGSGKHKCLPLQFFPSHGGRCG
jgi:hypothetical protein